MCITSWWTLSAWLWVHPSYFYSHMLAGFLPLSPISIPANFQAMFGHQVVPQRYRLAIIVLVWHCIGVYQSNEYLQHVSWSHLHTFMIATCWQVSHFRTVFEPTFRQWLAIKGWYVITQVLIYWLFSIVSVCNKRLNKRLNIHTAYMRKAPSYFYSYAGGVSYKFGQP